MKYNAKVIAINLDRYILKADSSEELSSKLRGNVKKKNNILVGDNIYYEKIDEDIMIIDVLERKNMLIRPPVSNIDQMIIVISICSPKPDYLLLDKQIILCMSKNIKPIICVNKIDLLNNAECKDEIEYINRIYGQLGIEIVYLSVVTGEGINELEELLNNKTSAFSGNSGVGKSSITSKILDDISIEVGDIGEKSKRGKHTTKSVSLYEIDKDSFILDTPGFSSYELYDIEYKNLRNFYTEFTNPGCDYEDCMHVTESDSVCNIKRKLKSNEIDKNRYERYVYLFQKLKEIDDKKYKK